MGYVVGTRSGDRAWAHRIRPGRRAGRLTPGRVALAVAGAACGHSRSLRGASAPAGAATTSPTWRSAQGRDPGHEDADAINQTRRCPRRRRRARRSCAWPTTTCPSDYTICSLGVEPAAKAIGWKYASIYFDPSNPASLDSALISALAKNPVAVINVGGQPTSTYSATTLAAYKAAKRADRHDQCGQRQADQDPDRAGQHRQPTPR